VTTPDPGSNGGAAWLARLADFARASTSGDVGEELNVVGRDRLVASFGASFARRRRHARGAAVGWGGASVIAVGAAAAQLLHEPATDSRIAGQGFGSGYVSGGSSAGRTVRFASGSSVKFAAGSRGRVGDLKAARARVVLEGGRATVQGEAHPPQDVLVEAGPYALRSGGGAFDVSWSGSVLEVWVASGAVIVQGPAGRQGPTLQKDQAFVAREPDGEVRCF
jgi:ferric-dicitrate binding protein FerR (iron transport regulator)